MNSIITYISALFFIFLFSCSLNSNSSFSPRSITAQIDENFIADLSLAARQNLRIAEAHVFDYAKANEIIVWVDEKNIKQGMLKLSQIFKVGKLICRRFFHERENLQMSLEATICRQPGGSWQIIK